MGKLEQEARSARRRGDIQRALLITLGLATIVTVGALAGNAIQLLGKPKDLNRFRYYAKTAAGKLVYKGLAEWVKEDGKTFLRITDKGRTALLFEKEKAQLIKKRKWDKRWRLVIFDIPERRKSVRFRLRDLMRDVGFVKLQASVWAFPYDCEEFVTLLKSELRVGKDVLYAIVEKIEYDKPLRQHFGLPIED